MKRLRAIADDTAGLTEEAAAEIERLLAAADGWEKLYRDGRAEIERLRALNAELVEASL